MIKITLDDLLKVLNETEALADWISIGKKSEVAALNIWREGPNVCIVWFGEGDTSEMLFTSETAAVIEFASMLLGSVKQDKYEDIQDKLQRLLLQRLKSELCA
jgi:hypothetical protein